MKRLVAFLIVAAVAGAAIYLAVGHPADARAAGGWAGVGLDPVSLVLGAVGGFVLTWLTRLPWGDIMVVIAGALRAWRQNAVMAVLALFFAGVLLLY